jgi:hypothetical protein
MPAGQVSPERRCQLGCLPGGRGGVLQGASLPGGDHRPLCLAVSPVPAQFPRGAGDDAGTGDHRQPRDGPGVVCGSSGQTYATGLRRRRARPGDKWYLDEVFIKIDGKTHYLWQAVDQDGSVLDILVTCRRDAKAATRFFRKLLKGLKYMPRVLVTDKLAQRRGSPPGADPGSGAPPVEVSEQPRRELPPAHPGAGTSDAEVHLPYGEQRFHAACSYSLIRPPRTGRRVMRSWLRSATGWVGCGGRRSRPWWGHRPL